VKTKAIRVMALGSVVLSAWVIPSCQKEEPRQPMPSAEAKAAADKAAADKAAADKAAADKAAAAKAAADKAAADKAAADKVAADKAAAAKSAADRAAGEKAGAEKAAAEAAATTAAAEKKAAQEKAEAAALPADLVVMKSEIARAVSQIDLTMAKLDALSSASGDLEKPGQDAIDAIAALDTETQAVKKRADEMRNRGAAYFDAWEKQLAAMSTPEVMAIASQRKGELSAKYAEVLTSMQECRAAFDPFWADMQSIHKTLEDGVTPETQKSLAPQIKAAKDKSTTLKSRVEATATKLNDVSAIYTKH